MPQGHIVNLTLLVRNDSSSCGLFYTLLKRKSEIVEIIFHMVENLLMLLKIIIEIWCSIHKIFTCIPETIKCSIEIN